jgi:hypothetical protein
VCARRAFSPARHALPHIQSRRDRN